MSIAGYARAGLFNHQLSSAANDRSPAASTGSSRSSMDLTNVPDHLLLDTLRELGVPVRADATLDPNTSTESVDRIRRFGEFFRPQHATGMDPALIIQTLLAHRLNPDAALGAIELHKQGAIELRVADKDPRASRNFVHHLARFAVEDGDTIHEHPLSLEDMFSALGEAGFDLKDKEIRTRYFTAKNGDGGCETTVLSPLGSALHEGNSHTAYALMNLVDHKGLHQSVGFCRHTDMPAGVDNIPLYPLDLAGRSGLRATAEHIARNIDLSAPEDATRSLQLAARHGSIEALETLIERGAKVDELAEDRSSALSEAVVHEQHGAIDFLLAHGGDPSGTDAAGRPLLAIALKNGDKAGVSRLLQDERLNVEDVSRRNGCGGLVNRAISLGWDDVAAELVERGARCDMPFQTGQSSLHMATDFGMHKTVAALLDKQVDVNQTDNRGKRAIHYAAQNAQDTSGALVDLLVANGAQVTFGRSNNMPPPLQLAVQAHATGAVKRLLAAGARIDLRDSDTAPPLLTSALSAPSETALSIAKSLGHHDIVHAIKHPETWSQPTVPVAEATPSTTTLRDRLQRLFGCLSPQTL